MIERKKFCAVLIKSRGDRGKNAPFLIVEGGGRHHTQCCLPKQISVRRDSYRQGLRKLQSQAPSRAPLIPAIIKGH